MILENGWRTTTTETLTNASNASICDCISRTRPERAVRCVQPSYVSVACADNWKSGGLPKRMWVNTSKMENSILQSIPGTCRPTTWKPSSRKRNAVNNQKRCTAYGGIRRTALSKIQCTDIVESSHQKQGVTTKSYAVIVKKGKGNKSRTVQLRSDIGKALYEYACGLGTAYLFPSKKNPGQPLNPHTIADRVKRIAIKIGQPTISMHAFRHFYASNSLHNGADLATVQQQLGHSSITTTSAYLHGNPKTNVSAMIDLSGDSDDITILHNFVPKPKKRRIRRKKKKKGFPSKLQ